MHRKSFTSLLKRWNCITVGSFSFYLPTYWNFLQHSDTGESPELRKQKTGARLLRGETKRHRCSTLVWTGEIISEWRDTWQDKRDGQERRLATDWWVLIRLSLCPTAFQFVHLINWAETTHFHDEVLHLFCYVTVYMVSCYYNVLLVNVGGLLCRL